MPTYYTPPPTPPPALPSPALPPPSRTDSWSRSDDASSQFHSTNTSKSSSSSSAGSKRHSSSHGSHGKHDEEGHSHKIPYAFLGSIAAAAYVAHKCWPKGFLYGDKEDWELSRHARRYRERIAEEKAALKRQEKGDYFPPRPPPPPAYADREQRRVGYRSSAAAAGSYSSREEEETELEIYRGRDPQDLNRGRRLPPPARSASLSRDREFDRYSETNGPGGRLGTGTRDRSVYRRTHSRERSIIGVDSGGSEFGLSERPSRRDRDSYYPPAPQWYLVERSASNVGFATAGSRYSDLDPGRPGPAPAPRHLLESRSSAASDPLFQRTESIRQKPRHYYEDDIPPRASEVVYVYRDGPPPTRPRRASVDAGLGRRYDGDLDWQYR